MPSVRDRAGVSLNRLSALSSLGTFHAVRVSELAFDSLNRLSALSSLGTYELAHTIPSWSEPVSIAFRL